MPSLMLTVFILQLVIHLINTIGAPVINEFLWVLYNKLPTSTSRDVQAQVALRRELVKLKQELSATSSQDEFAKWAKIRRTHDKKMAEHDELADRSKSFQSSFDRNVNLTRFLCTNGLRFFLQFWFAKRPMYWIPRGWVPSYVEWVLGLPRAPMGSVSIQIWGTACATVISIVGAAVVSILVLARERPEQRQEKTGEPVPVGFGGKATVDKKKS